MTSIFSYIFSPINIILGILLIEYALFKCKSPMKVNEERDAKYSAFRRYDVKYWKRWRLYLSSPIVLPRMVFSLSLLPLFYLIITIVLIGHKRGEPISKAKFKFLKWTAIFFCRILAISAGGLWFY